MAAVSMQAWTNLNSASRQAYDRYSRVLAQSETRTLLGASLVSVVGDWLNLVALITLSYEFSDGALGVGGLLALRMLPGLLLQGLAGALVDRFPGRLLLILSQVGMAAVAVSFISLEATQSLWLLYGLVILLETLNTLARPAFMVQLVQSVSADQRGAVNGLNAMAMTIAQFVGATAGAVLLAALTPRPLFLLNGLTFLGIALVVMRIRTAPRSAIEDTRSLDQDTGPATGPALEVSGYRQILRQPDVLVYCLLTLTASILIQAATALFEARARTLSLDEGGAGIFFAAVAIGLLFGGAVAGAGEHRDLTTLKLIALAEIASAIGLVVFGMAQRLPVAIVALILTGIMAELAEIPALTYFQHRLPAAVYGRFFSLFLMASAAGGLIGALGGPVLERHVSEAAALQLIAIPILISSLLLMVMARVLQPDPNDLGPMIGAEGAVGVSGTPEWNRRGDD